MNKLNKNAKKWVRALRSGKYRQTQTSLHDKKGFCCLGVACDLFMKEKGGKWKAGLADEKDMSFRGHKSYLPHIVRNWLGLKSSEGDFDYENVDRRLITNSRGVVKDSLWGLNDGGKTFKSIAKLIESKPKGLFKKDK